MVKIHRMFIYTTGKLATSEKNTNTTLNQRAMQSQKCRSCELQCKEAEIQNRKNNTLRGQKAIYSKFLKKVLEIITRSRQIVLTMVLHGITYFFGTSNIYICRDICLHLYKPGFLKNAGNAMRCRFQTCMVIVQQTSGHGAGFFQSHSF